MAKKTIDRLDNMIIRLLTENGRVSIGKMAKKLNVTSPTVRARLKQLEKSGLFRVSGLVDPARHQEIITALVAMSVRSEGNLDQVLDKISNLPNVVWIGVVTGRYDIIAEVICVGGKDELYRFTTKTILNMDNMIKSETFIILQSRHNWIRLPDGVESI